MGNHEIGKARTRVSSIIGLQAAIAASLRPGAVKRSGGSAFSSAAMLDLARLAAFAQRGQQLEDRNRLKRCADVRFSFSDLSFRRAFH